MQFNKKVALSIAGALLTSTETWDRRATWLRGEHRYPHRWPSCRGAAKTLHYKGKYGIPYPRSAALAYEEGMGSIGALYNQSC